MAETTIVIKAKDSTRKAFASVNKGLGKIRTGVNSTQVKVGLLTGIAGFAGLTKVSLASGDALAKTGDKIGIATDKLAELHHITSLYTSAGAGAMNEALTKATKRLGEFNATGGGAAAKWLEKLNLDTQQLATLSPDQLFNRYAESIRGLNDRGQQLAAISALMGDESRQLIGIVDESADSLAIAAAEAQLFGLALSRVDAAKMEAANDSFTRVGAITKGFSLQLTSEFAPILEGVANLFVENAKQAGGFGNVAIGVVDGLITGVGYVANAFRGMEIIWAGLRVSFAGMYGFVIGKLNDLQQSVVGFINLVPNIDIKPFKGLENAAAAIATVSVDAQAKLFALLNAPLPSEKIKAFSEQAQAEAQVMAEKVAAAKSTIGGNVGTVNTEALQEQLLAEEHLIRFSQAKRLQDEQIYKDSQAALEQAAEKRKTDAIQGALSNIGALMATDSKKAFNLGKAASLASAVIQGHKSAVAAYEAGMSVGGPAALGIAAAYAATSVAATAVQINAIKSKKFTGARELGGPVSKNLPYLVGERGPEIFTPNSSGNIISNKNSKNIGAPTNIIEVSVNAIDSASFNDRLGESANEIWNIIMGRMNEEGLRF